MSTREYSVAKIEVTFAAWFFHFRQIVIKWHVGIRRFSLSSEMPKNRQSRRKPRATIRRPQPRQRWCSPALCARWVWGRRRNRKCVCVSSLVIFLVPFCSPRCLIPKHSSSTLRASTRNPLFPLSWKGWRHKRWLTLSTYWGPDRPYFFSHSDVIGQ